jgi:WD40 repeat protein
MRSLLAVFHSLPSLNSSHLITGSTDESIRIFDLSELDSQPPPKDAWIGLAALPESKLPGMIVEVEGHSHDIIDLGMYTRVDEEGKMEAWLLSSSVDGTLRRWKWPEVLIPNQKPIGKIIQVDAEIVENNLLTEEEERELAELMGEDE